MYLYVGVIDKDGWKVYLYVGGAVYMMMVLP